MLIDAKYDKPISLISKLKDLLIKEKAKSIALFASIQFTNLDVLIKDIKKLGIKINITKAKRTNEPIQILGCDQKQDSYEDPIIKNSDLTLYIGDGLFHPKAIMLSQSKKDFKPIILFDPINNSVKKIEYDIIEKQIKKYKRNLRFFMNAKNIGILITTKPGQQYFDLSLKLKEKFEKTDGKKAYMFLENTINMADLENYPFIDTWVNSACPRIGSDDIVNIPQALINIRDAFDPGKALSDVSG